MLLPGRFGLMLMQLGNAGFQGFKVLVDRTVPYPR